jgi:hypothetical protein
MNLPESTNRECETFLVDGSTSKSKGHSWEYSKVFYNSYVKIGKCFHFLSPLAGSDGTLSNSNQIRVETMEMVVEKISDRINRSENKYFHIFILWAHQFLIEEHLSLSAIKIPPGKKVNIQILGKFPTAIGRKTDLEFTAFEADLAEAYSDSECQVHFYAWDPKANGKLQGNLLRPITEHFNYVDKLPQGQKSHINQGRNEVNFFGELTFKRGVGLFLLLALLNPTVKFRLVGNGVINRSLFRSDRYVSKLQTPFRWFMGLLISIFLSKLKKLPNISLFEDYYFTRHEDLEKDLSDRHFVFYSAKFSGLSSGIVNMALHYGIRMLYVTGNSPASDLLINNFPAGAMRWFDFFPFALKRKLRRLLMEPNPLQPNTEIDFLRDLENFCLDHGRPNT